MKAESASLFVLNTSDFNSIRELVHANTGISLSQTKMELVKRRFTPRLKTLGLSGFDEYVGYLKNNFDSEEAHFCNAITTNLTSFFREKHHFELMVKTIIPEIIERSSANQKVRIWSAGCSSGQEAYCMAIMLNKYIPDLQKRDIKILATDLDENCLIKARKGTYPAAEFEKVPEKLIGGYFTKSKQLDGRVEKEVLTAKDSLRSLITFNKLNLMHRWPMKGPFDLIFCRNVFIYFDKPTQQQILKGFSALQDDGGFLCMGHSEIISNASELGYRLIGKTAYNKISSRHL